MLGLFFNSSANAESRPLLRSKEMSGPLLSPLGNFCLASLGDGGMRTTSQLSLGIELSEPLDLCDFEPPSF